MFNKFLSFFKQKQKPTIPEYFSSSTFQEKVNEEMELQEKRLNETITIRDRRIAAEQKVSELESAFLAEQKSIRDKLSGIVKAEQSKKEKKFDKKCTLKITYLNNAWTIYSIEYDKLTGVVFPFRDFYTWYFSRTTPIFAFNYKDGETVMRRDQIFLVEYNKNIDI